MTEYFQPYSDLKSRRSKVKMTRTVNYDFKGHSSISRRNRRSRANKMKSVSFRMDALEMTGQLGKEGGREENHRLSPSSEVKTRRMKPERQYAREELIELMTHPLSSIKHPCLDSPQNKVLVSGRTGGRWLEDRWDQRKRTDSLTDEDRSDGSLDPQKKRMNDPKAERLRREQDVVLGPQRRSFNSGCFVNLPPQHANSANRRPESPLKAEREPSHREMPTRRIGSGRIMRDPMWDYRGVEKEEVSNQNMNSHDYNNFRQRDDRYDRRTYERSHEKERPQQRNSRYSNNERRKYEKTEPEEPEWFSGGPTSQHDTIELHGFDGPVDEKVTPSKKQNKNKNNSKSNRKSSESSNNKSDNSGGKKSSSRKTSPDLIEQPRSSSSPVKEKSTESIELQGPAKQNDSEVPVKNSREPEWDIEDIINLDSLPPLLSISNGCVEDGSSGSRFSQFFRRESPSPPHIQHQDSRHSSGHDEMFNSMIDDITSANISIPDGDTYFSPISPVASSVKEEVIKNPSANLLEMLQRGNMGFQGRKITKKPSLRDLEACGKIHSVEELEARLRQEQGIGKPTDYMNRPTNKEEELANFRKLMMNKQIQNMQDHKSSSHSGLTAGFQNQQQQQQQQHSMNQQQQHNMNQQQQHNMSQQQPQQQMPIPHDLVLKLLHVQQQQRQQQEVFAKLMAPPNRLAPNTQFNVPPPIAPLSPELQMHINNVQPTKELLQRPEAQTILRSLKRGEITILHLVEQLKRGTTMQPIHREMIASIIKLHGLQPGVPQREPSPAGLVPPSATEQLMHQMMHNQQTQQQQQQQLRIPSPHANLLQRVPSPRELVAHTQSILQNALLKKKLEEQKENFRKRQEMQRSHSPNVSVTGPGSLSPANQHPNTTSPTPLAFTPTSVLRKMTAEIKDNELSNKHQHLDTSQQPPKQGRAIVKGNNFSMPPPPVVASNMDYMSQLQFKSVQAQRNKLSQSTGNTQQHFMMGMNRNNIQPPSSRVRTMGGSSMLSQQQQGMTQAVQQLLMNHNYNNTQHRNNLTLKQDCQPVMRGQSHMSMGGCNYMNYQNSQETSHELSASPVSNQLARWFSPELLAQARAGKLPDMPPISPTQNMLSVEELERLQQAVHN